jgi:hypothetical protein
MTKTENSGAPVAPINRAANAQRAAIEIAIVTGDTLEEAARRRSLASMERKERAADAARQEAIQDAFRLYQETKRSSGKADWLAKLAMGQNAVLTRSHLAAAQVLRDHVRGIYGLGGAEIQERVDGGSIHNGQMERLIDARRKGHYALSAACEAVELQKILPGVLMVILDGRSLREASFVCGLSQGKALATIRNGVLQALDAASAYLGTSRD